MTEPREPRESAEPTSELDPAVPTLVIRAQSGDHAAFERLYRLHMGRVYALCLRLVADPGRAETLTQDVFVRVWEKLGSYRRRGAFGAWLRRLAINVVIEDRRAEARHARWLDPAIDTSAARGFPGRLASVSHPETAIDLERAIGTLPPGARLVFVLHDVYGYRHEEIAGLTRVAVGTAKAQLHRARRLLREALSDAREVIGQ